VCGLTILCSEVGLTQCGHACVCVSERARSSAYLSMHVFAVRMQRHDDAQRVGGGA